VNDCQDIGRAQGFTRKLAGGKTFKGEISG